MHRLILVSFFLCCLAASFLDLAVSMPEEITPDVVIQMRDALRKDEEDDLNERVVSSVVFREIGELAGSVAYAHALFEINLSDVDLAFDLIDEQDLLDLNSKLLPNVGVAGNRVVAQIARQKRRWRNIKSIFSYEALRENHADSPNHNRDKRFVPVILGIGAIVGSCLGLFNLVELNHISRQAKGETGKAFVITALQNATERVAWLESDVLYLNESYR
jgi:hypothetical protein